MIAVENEQTLYDDLLTPVIEEQERSCEEASFERLKSLQEEADDAGVAGVTSVVGATSVVSVAGVAGVVSEADKRGGVEADDDKTPVNLLFGGEYFLNASFDII